MPVGSPRFVTRRGRGLAAGLLGFLLLPAALPARPGIAQKAEPVSKEIASHALAAQARAILARECAAAGCHGTAGAQQGISVLKRDTLLTTGVLRPRDPEGSRLIEVLEGEAPEMPRGRPRLAAADLRVLRAWVASGAPEAETSAKRSFLSESRVVALILNDLEGAAEQERPYLRYYSLANLSNNAEVSERELELYRTSLSKLVNSLSWEVRVVSPRAIDPQRLVLRVDLRRYGWDRTRAWDSVLSDYPYGSTPRPLSEAIRRIRRLSGAQLPYVRVDWFVAQASVPPLYHRILGLPNTMAALEEKLQVHERQDEDSHRALRAGRRNSGVSVSNRVVARFSAAYGAFWRSYDHRDNRGPKNVFANPVELRPDGGEFIFNLPNGLQGYYIAGKNGTRLDAAPISIVRDSTNARDAEVRNGRSCMGCHYRGMVRFEDEIEPSLATLLRPQFDLDRAAALYRGQKALDQAFEIDETRFAVALAKSGSPLPGSDREEPINVLAQYYAADLSTAQAAADAGFSEAAQFRKLLDRSGALRDRLGFSQLLSNRGGIKRDLWEESFAPVLEELHLGTPYRLVGRRPAQVERRVADVRHTVSVTGFEGPSAKTQAARAALTYWLGQSRDLRIVSATGRQTGVSAEYQLAGSVEIRPNGAVVLRVIDPRNRMEETAVSSSGDAAAAAEQIANKLSYRIGGRLLARATAPERDREIAGKPDLVNPFERLLSSIGTGGDVRLALGLGAGPDATYRSGQRVEILFRVDRPCYVTLYGEDSEGIVTPLFPNADNPDNHIAANQLFRFDAQVDPTGSFGLERVFAAATLRDVPLPGIPEFRNDHSKSLRPLPDPPRVVAAAAGAALRQAVKPSVAAVRFFTLPAIGPGAVRLGPKQDLPSH